ncbi:MAG TPA: aspartate--tRNA ligase [Ruminococcaceae bacterium]|nr:aspartate--tRNA ligase [Oscillospiraceae bacterium]
MGNLRRTDYCGGLRTGDCGREVTVCGFVQRQRDLGQLIFIDLRDRTGLLQLCFDDNTDREIFSKAFQIRSEYVLMAKGKIRERSSVNPELPTGEIELFVDELRVLSQAETPPFEILPDSGVKEDLRLKYRFLDLRRPDLQGALITRHKITKCARDYFDRQGFIDIETPMLIKSTPEGARDYLVPSRVQQGSFFALPQSPQLYKQLLMVAGFDRYFQIAKCFRDEDLRADRQPEFTQIDIEMSFVGEDEVMSVNEGFIKEVFREILDTDIPTPFPRMPYREAMDRFGSDKPDIRFGMELCDLSGILSGCEARVFRGALDAGGCVRGINVKGGAGVYTRKEIDKLIEWIKAYGAKGLAYTRITPDAVSSSFEKFLSEAETENVRRALNAETGDLLLLVADADSAVVFDSLGALRIHTAKRLDIIDENRFAFLWVTDFPLVEYDAEEQRFTAKHHPFTSPKDEDLPLLETDIAAVRAKAYDMVLNGTEIGGGSVRINDIELQNRMFDALGFERQDAENRFGFLLNAFKYGVPPHGGMAYGLDRLVMLMLKKESIRDVMAYPKVASSGELMSGAPSGVDGKQLGELGIKIASAEE